jgi:hypothetical protein
MFPRNARRSFSERLPKYPDAPRIDPAFTYEMSSTSTPSAS